jgi:hypothetical protein
MICEAEFRVVLSQDRKIRSIILRSKSGMALVIERADHLHA